MYFGMFMLPMMLLSGWASWQVMKQEIKNDPKGDLAQQLPSWLKPGESQAERKTRHEAKKEKKAKKEAKQAGKAEKAKAKSKACKAKKAAAKAAEAAKPAEGE